jgi:hypothetical protein
LASANHVQPDAGDGLHGVGDKGEELHALSLVIHPTAIGLEGEVQSQAFAGHPDLTCRALGIHHHLLSGGRRHCHHVPGAVGVQNVRVDFVQCPHQRLKGRGHEVVVTRFVHAPVYSEAEVGGHRQSRLREKEQLRSGTSGLALETDDGAGGNRAWKGLHGEKVCGQDGHGGVVAHQHNVLRTVLVKQAVETSHRHVRKEAFLSTQRDLQCLGKGENLRCLHGADEGAREDERDSGHAWLKGRKMGVRLSPRFGGESASPVIQTLGNFGIRIGMPNQKNLHPCLQPVVGPLPSVVHERARQGQRVRRTLALSLLLVSSVGCRTQVATQAIADAGAAVTLAILADDAGAYRLTSVKLDAFLTYKRALLEEGEPSAAQLRELLHAVDTKEPEAVERAWTVLHAQGAREAAARARTGLTSTEVRLIESMAADVAAARVFVRPLGLGKLFEDLAAARNSLPPERRAAVDATLEALQEDEARVEHLADERAAWGDANVDLLLTREKELVRLFETQLRGARERISTDAGR